MDSNYDLKINDFGQASNIEGSLGGGMFKTSVGTEAYRSPE